MLTDEHRLKARVESVARKRKNPAAVALARLAVKARMKKVTSARRREIARLAALARWAERKNGA
jgi:hypothetical protein